MKTKTESVFVLKAVVTTIAVCAVVFFVTLAAEPAEAAESDLEASATTVQNGKIAYDDNIDGDYEIYTVNPDGSDRTQLTDNVDVDTGPSWSPDGEQIAFSSNRAHTGGEDWSELFKMNADGSNVVQLTSNGGSNADPAWSPDGSKIAFALELTPNDPPFEFKIYVVNADGTNPTALTAGSGSDRGPAWSPDGTKIAFYSDRLDPSFLQVYVMNGDGTGVTQLTFDDGGCWSGYHPSWSPDGTRIAFVRQNSCGIDFTEIFVINLVGGSLFQVTSNGDNNYSPNYSPDGTKIAYFRQDIDTGDVLGIFTINPDGTGESLLAGGSFGGGGNNDLSWGPLQVETPATNGMGAAGPAFDVRPKAAELPAAGPGMAGYAVAGLVYGAWQVRRRRRN